MDAVFAAPRRPAADDLRVALPLMAQTIWWYAAKLLVGVLGTLSGALLATRVVSAWQRLTLPYPQFRLVCAAAFAALFIAALSPYVFHNPLEPLLAMAAEAAARGRARRAALLPRAPTPSA